MKTGTQNLLSIILNVAPVGLLILSTARFALGSAFLVASLVITQFSETKLKSKILHN